ncbi:MAG TPA: hypothetical protein VF830_04100 [Gemmatimonadales bacterium]|jgi:hypothetical protein
MRMLIALAVVASLAACTQQADNGVGRPPPETGRISPPDSGMNTPPPGGPADTAMRPATPPPDTALHPMRRDST